MPKLGGKPAVSDWVSCPASSERVLVQCRFFPPILPRRNCHGFSFAEFPVGVFRASPEGIGLGGAPAALHLPDPLPRPPQGARDRPARLQPPEKVERSRVESAQGQGWQEPLGVPGNLPHLED